MATDPPKDDLPPELNEGGEPLSIIPQAGERGFVVGGTGSGKTAFVVWLMEHMENSPILIYDTKDEPKFEQMPHSVIVYDLAGILQARDDLEIDYIIFRPSVEDLSDPSKLDSYLMWHYQNLRGVDAYIDEIYTFHNAGRCGPGLTALLTRGRSRGISTLMASQRPAWLSMFCISEAQKIYIFKLAYKGDRKRIAEFVPDYDANPPVKHSFYFYEVGEEAPILMAPIQIEDKYNSGYTDQTPTPPPEEVDEEKPPRSRHAWI